ncbi:SLC13 family permease [Novosphingobium sp. 1949]|uniref:SLC13 family permease n=1 Tax=Novosphingobium organovorum TaxID=2930092 RepID=A0ABT0BFC7_9SPHN|nr:SLC13 family permease [Novosphingobium organovorum]MCJ2183558.1 SLC13 family permease [Novosphingobium organovorum]
MTFAQWAIIAILLGMMAAYASERFRVELVAMSGLGAGFALGVVPVQSVFSGFSNPAVITVAEILLVVAALAQSRVIDTLARRFVARARNETAVLAVLCSLAAVASTVMNNIGALALFFPVTLSVCARLGIASGRMLMPLSFATLLGGICSLTGTPANLVVNDWMVSQTGGGFGFFGLAWVGLPVVLAGLVWLVLAGPHLLRAAPAVPSGSDVGPAAFLAELVVPAGSGLTGLRLPAAEQSFDVVIHGVVRSGAHVFARRADIVVMPGDVVLIEADFVLVDQLVSRGLLAFAEAGGSRAAGRDREEAVVMPDSFLLGSRIGDVALFAEQAVRVVGLASRRHRVEGRFADLPIGLGDVLILEGEREALRVTMSEGALLALSRRRPPRLNVRAATGVVVFAAGVLASALELVPTEVAFGAVVFVLAVTRCLNLRTALQEMNWPIVLLLACMIPLGVAVQDTGAARIIANAIVAHLPVAGPAGVIALVLVMAIAITPFVDNVSTAAVLSPIAAGISARTGVAIEPLLMAVAVGTSLDFLTPFGHHNNAVVMGAGGYRFTDFPRFGAPLLAVCFVAALLALLALV